MKTTETRIKTTLVKKWILTLLVSGYFSACSKGDVSYSATEVPSTTVEKSRGKQTAPVELGLAKNFVILAASGISTVPPSAVVGNMGISPAPASYITGFSLSAPPGAFTLSTQVTGKVYASDYLAPTPATLTTAMLNMQAAYDDAAGRAPDVTELGAGDISGLTLPPGVYKWGTGLLITKDIKLMGGAKDVWIFEIAQGFTMTSGVKIILAGGAQPKNIFWQTFGVADLGTTSHFEGILMSKTSIVLRTGASVNGRLLAQTAITMDQNAVVQP